MKDEFWERAQNELQAMREDHERRVRHIRYMTRWFWILLAFTIAVPLIGSFL